MTAATGRTALETTAKNGNVKKSQGPTCRSSHGVLGCAGQSWQVHGARLGASRLLMVMASRSTCGLGKAMIFMKKKAAGLGYEQGPRTAPLFYVGLIKS